MNIFFLDRDPGECASQHCDKHVSKMIIEYAQLMSTAHRLLDSPYAEHCYKATHVNHPCAIWTRESREHYDWLFKMWRSLCFVYTARYGKIHATEQKMYSVLLLNPVGNSSGWTDPPQCMPDEFKADDTIDAYRNLYMFGKSFAEWRHSEMPEWFAMELKG